MGDEHYRAGVGVQCLQHLAAAGGIEVVRRLVNNSTFAAETTSVASASRVFSPPTGARQLLDAPTTEQERPRMRRSSASLTSAVRCAARSRTRCARVQRLVLLGVVTQLEAVSLDDSAASGRSIPDSTRSSVSCPRRSAENDHSAATVDREVDAENTSSDRRTS